MNIRLLGTGASDGIPAFFGDSEVSRYARKNGGKDLRSRAAAIVDQGLKIDLPPDTFMQMTRDRLDPNDWTALLFTHSHDDHCAISELQYALFPFTDREFLHYPIYANAMICDLIHARYPQWPLEIVETRSFCPFVAAGYGVIPFKANHKEDEDSQNFLVQKDGRTLAYATDTGIWFEETWEFLQDYRLDLLVIECTEGFNPTTYHGHIDIPQLIGMVERLKMQGTLTSESQVFTTHHSHLGGATHAQLEEALAPHGIVPGFDGQVIEV